MTVTRTNSVASSVAERQDAQHILVRIELDRNVTWNLTPGRHAPLELVYAVRNTFDHMGQIGNVVTPFRTPLATTTFRLFSIPEQVRLLLQSPPFLRRIRRIATWEIDICVRQAFALFDEYFFFNQIGRYTRVELVEGLQTRGMLGCATDDLSRGGHYILILLDYQDAHGSSLSPEAKAANMKKVLGVLLHEMVHALFLIFRCKCARCERDNPYLVGDRGHRIA